jgi:hypothetical protein
MCGIYEASYPSSTRFQAAARRIVAYWKMKRQLFGERAFLPLAEALTKEDVDMLRSGFIQGLPYDEMKRKVNA